MATTRWTSFVPGMLLTVLGIIFLSPLFYRERPFDGNAVGPFLGITLGSSFLLIGISSLLHARKSHIANAKDGFLLLLGQIYKWLGHSVVLLAIVGTLWLVLFARAGSASGVPIGIGIFVSLFFYGLGVLCKALGRKAS